MKGLEIGTFNGPLELIETRLKLGLGGSEKVPMPFKPDAKHCSVLPVALSSLCGGLFLAGAVA